LSETNYSFIERKLHYLALGLESVAEMSFALEKALWRPSESNVSEKPHVFIAGLARAGTTILMKAFYDTGRYRSLTYRDMPFVLMPGTWSRISSSFRKHKDEEERSHGDSVMVNFDSPEALEEVFWRIFTGDAYLYKDRLKPYQATSEQLRLFRQYVNAIVHSSGENQGVSYLSKNNNNILRLPSIRKAFPEAVILIPFRDPLQHAFSLRKQHENFLAKQKEDDFSVKYMTWLAHHEFGLDHRPFRFNKAETGLPSNYKTENLEYWLLIWINTYKYLLENKPENAIFVAYEALCRAPDKVLGDLFMIAGFSQSDASNNTDINLRNSVVPDQVVQHLYILARDMYEELCAQFEVGLKNRTVC